MKNHVVRAFLFRKTTKQLLVGICILIAGLSLARSGLAQQQPNIIVILADDLGYGDVGFNGAPDIPTPNIDALAAAGVMCTDGYVTEPFCAPSRAAIMTGRYQQRFGFDSGPEVDNDNPLLGLPLTEMTLAELLKPAGYVCGAIGKWHLGTAPAVFPLQRGFDEFVGFLGAQASYYNAYLYNGYTVYQEPTYLTDAFTREAVSFITNHAKQPFFLYLAYNAVHEPYDPAPDVYVQVVKDIQNPQRRNYAAMVVGLDAGIGQVVQTLKTNNLLNNTLIFFLSDNGAPDKSFTTYSNAPLRGYKTDTLEGGIRVPFAVQWPAGLPRQTVYNGMISSLDIFATAAAAAGVDLPMDRVYDGTNMVPYLAGKIASPPRTFFWRWLGLGPNGPLGALNTIWGVRNGPFKLVVERAKDTLPPALYNLSRDIGETRDLASKSPSQVTALQTLYNLWQQDTVPAAFQKDTDTELLPLVLAGDWNGFNKDDTNPPWNLTRITAPDPIGTPDAYNWLFNTIHVASTGGDTTPGTHSFNIIGAGDYGTQWGNTTIQIDGLTTVRYTPGHSLGTPNTITLQNGYYSFRLVDTEQQPRADMTLAVFKTSAPPVSVTRTGQVPQNPGPTDPIQVSIATSQSKSPEERVYVRWSNDFFITSHMVQATGSGTRYTATIPAQPAGTSALYTVLTSTADLSTYSTSGAIDGLTLAVNGVFNAVPPTAPSITQQPQSTSVPVGKRARFTVTAGGTAPYTYQWKKNGVNILGANQPVYQTAPTTTGDNGAIFTVLVTNRASSILSNNAILTVN